MNGTEAGSCETRGRQELLPIRQAWVDPAGKIISFHPIDAGQLVEAVEPLFWENILFLSETGYRIQ